ncbi:hypothetical protein GN958_ATG20381 [Phytophthora infestans]|uniref:Uncharacterized protein n=1 Tax=Phytophthora infestans TaxID=4787 RepID=A0A8S9TU23_PHYIN|nr:hypothetical protein GN958_ATG20381 [Phytophthora infestans]
MAARDPELLASHTSRALTRRHADFVQLDIAKLLRRINSIEDEEDGYACWYHRQLADAALFRLH